MFTKQIEECIIHVTDAEGNKPDLSHYPEIAYLINEKDNGINSDHMFRSIDMEQEDGEIYGCTLLSYFTPQPDGSLMEPEGNKVQLVLKESGAPLLVTSISRPSLTDDKKINMDYLSAFCELVGITKGDELFANILSEEGKTFIAEERAKKVQKKTEEETASAQLQKKQEMQADYDAAIAEGDEAMKNENLESAKTAFIRAKQIADDAKAANIELEFKPESSHPEAQLTFIAEKETLKQTEAEKATAIEKKQTEDAIRASIDPEYLVDELKYKQQQKFYADLGFTEYEKDAVHFFYGKEWRDYKQDPFILVRRGSDFLENVENDLDTQDDAITETEKEVKLGFLDGEERKVVTLDLEKGEISITSEAEQPKE